MVIFLAAFDTIFLIIVVVLVKSFCLCQFWKDKCKERFRATRGLQVYVLPIIVLRRAVMCNQFQCNNVNWLERLYKISVYLKVSISISYHNISSRGSFKKYLHIISSQLVIGEWRADSRLKEEENRGRSKEQVEDKRED